MSAEKMKRQAEILMVEDDPADAELTKEAWGDNDYKCNWHVAEDGEAALDFLLQKGKYAESPRPDLILLDLNLPRKDGRELLAEIKSMPELKKIPVIVLSTSNSDKDIHRAYELHANCYICKPMDFKVFVKIMRNIKRFWLDTVILASFF